MNSATPKTQRPPATEIRKVIVAASHEAMKSWLVIGLTSVVLGGCVAPAPDNRNLNANTQKSASYLDSAGVTNSQKRISQNLAESMEKRREQVSWGGVAVFGNKAEGEDLPISSKLVAEFQEALVKKLRAIRPANLDLKNLGSGVADNLRSQDALIMVVALQTEYSNHRPDPFLTGKIRGEMTIKGQLLFLDSKKDMKLVANYPVGITQREAFGGEPSLADFSKLATTALMGSERFPDGRPASLSDQVTDLLAGNAVVPRATFPPAEVSSVTFAPACLIANTPHGPVNIPAETLARWSDEFALAFGSYIGTGSGFAVNPYLPGGGKDITPDRVLNAARRITMRTVDGQQRNVRLKSPTLIFKVEMTNLRSIRNEKNSNQKAECVNYCISGKLRVVNNDTGQLVQQVPLEWPPSPSQRLSAELIGKYMKQSEKRLFLGDSADHIDIWQTKLDLFLKQLAREIAFPEEDLARRFENLRSQLKLNAGLNSQPVNYASLR